MQDSKLLTQNTQSTLIAQYTQNPNTQSHHQSEKELEEKFIQELVNQGYVYLNIKDEKGLKDNLKKEIQRLNEVEFNALEWERFFTLVLARTNDTLIEKTQLIQKDFYQEFTFDDGSSKNIYLIKKDALCQNSLAVINQYKIPKDKSFNRLDVTLLVNGLPLVHCELKNRGVALKEAFNQINRYANESFSESYGLFNFVQIFIISNGQNTKYYSNTIRAHQASKKADSFEFTMDWADLKNNHICELLDFAKTFLAKNTLLNILTKYCVFDTHKNLKIMRPYQIAACEKILDKIKIAHNHKLLGTKEAGGFIWHSTGSGKTLTSFKTAILAQDLGLRVLFVVDRKDLDYQTMSEYENFQKGAANSTKSVDELAKKLYSDESKIIITTIQKLAIFVKTYKNHKIFTQKVVLIFDECHRSQFGKSNANILKAFKNYCCFGFTGTPIMKENASDKTTSDIFGQCLHSYTLANAIKDNNVLPFKIDFIQTMKKKEELVDKQVAAIDTQEAFNDAKRLKNIVDYVFEHFDQKTCKREFNSIFASSSIDAAKLYYEEFKKFNQTKDPKDRLKIGVIFSTSNKEEEGFIDEENSEDASKLSAKDGEFLDKAIKDYNELFGSNFDIRLNFENYYRDLSKKLKEKELDVLIVVNMFLTGFDAKTLNTLWVDKDLSYHGLLQAYSRTNRIYNDVKKFGNIVCFRDLEQASNEAITLFNDKKAVNVALMKTFKEYYEGFSEEGVYHQGYKGLIKELLENFEAKKLCDLDNEEKRAFVRLFGKVLKMQNILLHFDEFENKKILNDRQMQDFQGLYEDIRISFRDNINDKEKFNEDLIFEIQLLRSVTYDYKYIFELLSKCCDKEELNKQREDILRVFHSSPHLRSKQDLIEKFLNQPQTHNNLQEDFENFIKLYKKEEFEQIIKKHDLKQEASFEFMRTAFKSKKLESIGRDFANLLPDNIDIFSPQRALKKAKAWEDFEKFYEKYKEFSLQDF